MLDLHGNHAQGKCPSAMGGLHGKHKMGTKVIHDFAGEAGMLNTKEPATESLLLEEFSAPECRKLFPRHAGEGEVSGRQEVADRATCYQTATREQSEV